MWKLLPILVLLACCSESLAFQYEEPSRDRDYKSHPEDAPGKIDPETGEYHPNGCIPCAAKEQQREAEYNNDLKTSTELGMSVKQYRELMSDRYIQAMKRLDQPKVQAPLAKVGHPSPPPLDLQQQARELAKGRGGGILTLTWSAGAENQYSVQVTKDLEQTTQLSLGEANDFTTLDPFVAKSGITFLEGDLPNNGVWQTWLRTRCRHCVISSRRSGNSTISAKAFAALLATTPRKPQDITVYNALPYETDSVDSFRERTRMHIQGSRKEWIEANGRVSTALGTANPEGQMMSSLTAEKASLLKDLGEGSSDIVLVFAHSDGTKIFMPGKNGSAISINELRAVKRKTTPNRVVILIACKAGGVNEQTGSIAEALLENKLAASVFAYPGSINLAYVPQMLNRLRSGVPLRTALSGLYQIVTLQGAADEFYPQLRSRPWFRVRENQSTHLGG